MYDYRNRWYLPEAGVFGERDPVGFVQSPSPYAALRVNPANAIDPSGKIGAFDSFNEQPENREQQKKFFSGQIPISPEERAFARLLGSGIVLMTAGPAVVYVLPEGALLSGSVGGAVAFLSSSAEVWRLNEPIDRKVDQVLVSTATNFAMGTVPGFVKGAGSRAVMSAIGAGGARIYVLLRKNNDDVMDDEDWASVSWSALVAFVAAGTSENVEGQSIQKAVAVGGTQLASEFLMMVTKSDDSPYNSIAKRAAMMRSCHLHPPILGSKRCIRRTAIYAVVVLQEQPSLVASH
jgi:hypothetical protein